MKILVLIVFLCFVVSGCDFRYSSEPVKKKSRSERLYPDKDVKVGDRFIHRNLDPFNPECEEYEVLEVKGEYALWKHCGWKKGVKENCFEMSSGWDYLWWGNERVGADQHCP